MMEVSPFIPLFKKNLMLLRVSKKLDLKSKSHKDGFCLVWLGDQNEWMFDKEQECFVMSHAFDFNLHVMSQSNILGTVLLSSL